MIVATCLNPALDVTYSVAALQPGTSHRVRTVRRRPGGKGVNVASVLTQQAVPALVTGTVGGRIGDELIVGLDTAGIAHRFSPIAGTTRQTVTITSEDEATVLNEPGPIVTDSEWEAFTAVFAGLLDDAEIVTLSGSLPGGVRSSAYAELIGIAHQHDAVVILDCEGESLVEALHAGPDIVKINEHEAASSTGIETDSTKGVFAAAEELHVLGAVEVVITRGAAGVAARTRDGRFVGTAARTVNGNPTGAGDAFTAGLAASTAEGADWPTRLRRASAWAAAAVAMPTAGELDLQVATDHENRTTIEEIPK
ncbi:1-phosphofructokinase family hexose kinase [Flexivirga alba]|uniref:1-phosphofructokinase family hexose kinase n=1 Tax=Flexivirga alba TaxID=702742 RepID=A0ABW2AHI5_9MICO